MSERIRLEMTMSELIYAMSEGNPGAVTALAEMIAKGPSIDPQAFMGGLSSVLTLDSLGIYGSRVYMLWSDVCGRDVVKTIAVLRAYQLGQLAGATQQAIEHAIENRGVGLDTQAVLAAVMERLPQFNRVAQAAPAPEVF